MKKILIQLYLIILCLGCSEQELCNDEYACNFSENDSECYYCFENSCEEFPIDVYDCDGNCLTDSNNDGICDGINIDIDGNIYNSVIIGNQEWLATNLKVTHYNNGDEIPTEIEDSEWWSLISGAYSVYNNDIDNKNIFGLLYNWFAIDDERGICPDGWAVPSDEDWKVLEAELGMQDEYIHEFSWRGDVEGGKLKSIGYEYWNSPNVNASNEFNFSALPGGARIQYYGPYDFLGQYASFWTSTSFNHYEDGNDLAIWRMLSYNNGQIYRDADNKSYGNSVRCFRNIEN